MVRKWDTQIVHMHFLHFGFMEFNMEVWFIWGGVEWTDECDEKKEFDGKEVREKQGGGGGRCSIFQWMDGWVEDDNDVNIDMLYW